MRCTECGYANEQGTKICVKCGTKLSASNSEVPASSRSLEGAKTVIGNISNQPAWDVPSSIEPSNQSDLPIQENFYRCAECGHYPLKFEVSASHPCSNCNSTGSKTVSVKAVQSPSAGKTMKLEDLNIGSKNPKVVVTEVSTGKAIEFEGDEIHLNRGNLDPSNDAISSNHATLNYVNGNWNITDHSSNEATFIQVKGTMQIPEGAKVIFGNKIFKIDNAE